MESSSDETIVSIILVFNWFCGRRVVKGLGGRVMMINCYRMPTGTSDLLDFQEKRRINGHNQ